jgi:hypothetical protein
MWQDWAQQLVNENHYKAFESKGVKKVVLAVLIVAPLVGAIGYFVLTHNQAAFTSRPLPGEMALPLRDTQSEINSASERRAGTTSWKAYRNEHYGVIFKYPSSLKVSETNAALLGEQVISIQPTNKKAEDYVVAEPPISIAISSVCLAPENVPEESWKNNFQQPLVFGDPLEDMASTFLKSYQVGARKLFVFNQGCYECYDGVLSPNPYREYNGYAAYSCEAGLNKNGNKAARCLTIVTERQKIGSPELKQLQRFFLDDFIPTLELRQSVMIGDCDGLGE